MLRKCVFCEHEFFPRGANLKTDIIVRALPKRVPFLIAKLIPATNNYECT
jgi:hypothetical protein